jgi:alkylation response protein AidB-like acyl-CoA dehydrogenase
MGDTVRITDDPTSADLREAVRSMMARHIEPRLEQEAPGRPVSADALRSAFGHVATTGLFGARAPEPYGTRLPLVLAGTVVEELPAFLAVATVAQEATAFRLGHGAPAELREKYLPGLVDGSLIAGSAISEPEVGSASNHVTTAMTVDGVTCRLKGAKLWTTNASVADVIVVAARDTRTDLVGRVLVDTAVTPVAVRDLPMSGLAQGHLCEIGLDIEVPAGNVFDDAAAGPAVMTTSWTLNRVSMGLIACALARSALDAAVGFATTRSQFGKPIGAHQLVQELLADAATGIEAGRLLCYRALSLMDDGADAVTASSMAKLFATETALQAVLKCQQVAGAAGLSEEYPFARLLRDVRMLTIPDGTTQIQQLIIGRRLTGLAAFT